MNSKNTAIAYARVSTDEQAKEGLSIEAQIKVCNEKMISDGYVPLTALKDEGKSGKDMNRPAMRELLRLVNEKEVAAVYVVHSDRIGRNVKDYLVFQELLKKQGIKLVCIYEPMLDDSATGKTIGTMLMTFSEMQRLITGEKVTSVMLEKVKAGYYPTRPPAGYYNATNPDPNAPRAGRKIIVVHPEMGPLVTETFERYSRGDTNVSELADLMYARGFRNGDGRKVQANRMYELLKNRIYLGEVHWRGLHVKEGKHEPLVEEDVFNLVQSVLEEKNKRACRRRKYDWLLAGLIRCPVHQRRYTAEWHMDKKIAYYHCSHAKGCGSYIEHTKLEGIVAEKFRDLEFSDAFVELVIGKARGTFLDRRKRYDARKQGLVNRRTAWESKRRVAEEKLFANTLSDDDFTRIRKDIQVNLSQIDNDLVELERQQEINVDVAQEILLLTRNVYKSYCKASPTLKRKHLLFFWEHFEVLNGVIISTTPTPLFDALLRFEAAHYRTQENAKLPEIAQTNAVILRDVESAQQESNLRPSP